MMPNWPENDVFEAAGVDVDGEEFTPALSSWSVTGIPNERKGLLWFATSKWAMMVLLCSGRRMPGCAGAG